MLATHKLPFVWLINRVLPFENSRDSLRTFHVILISLSRSLSAKAPIIFCKAASNSLCSLILRILPTSNISWLCVYDMPSLLHARAVLKVRSQIRHASKDCDFCGSLWRGGLNKFVTTQIVSGTWKFYTSSWKKIEWLLSNQRYLYAFAPFTLATQRWLRARTFSWPFHLNSALLKNRAHVDECRTTID